MMMRALHLVVLAAPAAAFSPAAHAQRAALRHSTATASIVPPEFSDTVFSEGTSESMQLMQFFCFGFVRASMFATNMHVPEDEEEVTPSEEAAPSPFGWLQADLRVPLPEWEELTQTCHLIGSDGDHLMYLCAKPEASLSECQPSTDFSAYYAHQVFICKGGKAPRELVATKKE